MTFTLSIFPVLLKVQEIPSFTLRSVSHPCLLSRRSFNTKLCQRVSRRRQWPEAYVEAVCAGEEEDVVHDGPRDVQPAASGVLWRPGSGGVGHGLVLDPRRGSVRSYGCEALLSLHAAPEAREADPVAEGVDEDDGVEGAGADVDEGGEPAEEGGIGELEEGAKEDGEEGCVGVGESEFVEVMDVGDAEVEGRDEDCGGGGDVGEEVDGDEDRAEEDFFCDGASDEVAIADPGEEGCGGGGGVDAFDEEALEEGAGEEGEGQEEWREDGGIVDRVPAEEVEGLEWGVACGVDDESEGRDGGDEAGDSHGMDTSSDDRRGIPVKGRGGACRRRKVEREDVEEGECDLEAWKSARHMPRMLTRARRLNA